MPTVGIPSAPATCIAPELFPANPAHWESSATRSPTSVSPAATSPPDRLAATTSAQRARSVGEPTSTHSARPTSCTRRSSQRSDRPAIPSPDRMQPPERARSVDRLRAGAERARRAAWRFAWEAPRGRRPRRTPRPPESHIRAAGRVFRLWSVGAGRDVGPIGQKPCPTLGSGPARRRTPAVAIDSAAWKLRGNTTARSNAELSRSHRTLDGSTMPRIRRRCVGDDLSTPSTP